MKQTLKLGSGGIAIIAVIVLVFWLASGDVSRPQHDRDDVWEEMAHSQPRVQYRELNAEPFHPEVVVQGQIQPWQSVQVRAQLTGQVETLHAREGDQLASGDALLTLSADDRPAMLAQANARLAQLRADVSGAERLRQRNMVSEAELLTLRAELAAAQAAVDNAKLAKGRLVPTAPFAGTVNQRYVEQGDLVQPGDPLITLVNTQTLRIVGHVPQQRIKGVAAGQSLQVSLSDGETLEATVTFVASSADPQTRAFRIEAKADNPNQLRVAGASATLRIALDAEHANFISLAHLALNNDGRLSVPVLTDDQTVRYLPVQLLSTDTNGAWVGGLPDNVKLITRGAGFVRQGQTVDAVAEQQDDPA